jgi:putative endonuclease
MPHMYILECADGSFYIGSTVNLERRLAEHDLGLGAGTPDAVGPSGFAEEFDRVDVVLVTS